MSTAARVSVVIPVFNGERYLASAIASVRAQTHPAAEVIVVNDGSTDGSLEAARAAAREWPLLQVISQPNGGPSAARNTGTARATGDFITFLDCDDEMLPDRIGAQLAYLDEHSEADLIMGTELVDVHDGVEEPDWLQLHRPGVPDPYMLSMMVRRAAFDRVGPFDPDRRLAEDVNWLFRARAAGVAIAVVKKPFLRRRIHGANLTTGTMLDDMREAMLQIARRLVEAKRDGPDGGGAP